MSARGTPTGTPSRRGVKSPTSPTTNYRRRQPSTSYLPSVPELARSTSSFSHLSAAHLQSSQASLSGTSTPGSYTPRRKRPEKLDSGDTDWSALDPDEVFRRLPVGEVKRVEAKMRADAMNKQSELRSMVGTRYRDLLTSATQITSLRNSSLRLAHSLKEAEASCASPQEIGVTAAPSEQDIEEDVMSLLPVAAHMKLLLDAPEALYALLARHAFLQSAFLWLVARVVKESLSSMPEDVNQPYLSLLQKQWETLLPFRGQIVQRATAALRSRDSIDSKALAETLLAIVLLDNLALPDALALFLQQRTKTLRDILQPSGSSHHSVQRRQRRESIASTRSISKEREEIGSVLSESVSSLLETVALVRAVFGKRAEDESLLGSMERLVQIGEHVTPSSDSPFTTPVKSHDRRASRLASISTPIPKPTLSATSPPVSAYQVLQGLPSAQILLRHLPSNITSFTPFIAPSTAPDVHDKLSSWQSGSIGLLREAIPEWLGALHSVSDVWAVRKTLNGLLVEGEVEEEIKAALEAEWGKRIEAVWNDKLAAVVDLAGVKVREAGSTVGEESDVNPESYTFSNLAFPPAPTHALTASSTPFNTFLASVKKRTALRTPLLDTVLTALESTASELKAENAGLPKKLSDIYGRQVGESLQRLVETLEMVMGDVASSRDGTEGIVGEMFVGRVAIYLAKQSTFLADLAGSSDIKLDDTVQSLTKVHAASVVRWRERAVEEALVELAPIFEPLTGPKQVQSSWQGPQPVSPSPPISVALQSLVKAVRRLGLPPRTDLPVVKTLVEDFVGKARGLDGWKGAKEEAIAQAAFDLGFLGLLLGEKPEKNVEVQKLLPKIPTSLPSEFGSQLPSLILDHFRRTQLIIRPLTSHLDLTSIAPVPAPSETRNGLLKLGAPKFASGAGADFRSPLAVAKPGNRFTLLAIPA